MTVEAVHAVQALQLPPAEKAVLIALAWRLGNSGCWPSLANIMEFTCLSERTARRALRGLEAGGHITRIGNGFRGTNKWSIRGAIMTPVTMTPGGSPRLSGGSPWPKRGVTVAPDRLLINNINNEAPKNGHSGAGKEARRFSEEGGTPTAPQNSGTMSREEAMKRYGNGATH